MNQISRREFLKFQAASLAWLAGASLAIPSRGIASDNPDIAVISGGAESAVRAAIEALGGIKAFVKEGDRVVIKPNMSFASGPENAANTHPDVVRTIALLCREAGAGRILVLDNPLAPAEQCLDRSGIRDACKDIDKDMVYMVSSQGRFSSVKIENAHTLKETEVMREVLAADVLIAAPVAKSHAGTGVSLSMKGMMGLIHNRRIMHRLDLHSAIADLASLLTPDLVVIDATRVLSTGGPGGPGKVLKPDMIIASRDMVAADAFAISSFEWYGQKYTPDQVRYVRLAHERGLGRMDIENLNIVKRAV
jgi:uncharacterized protein (DUF362 family)